MSMNYKAHLDYAVVEGKEDKSSRAEVPVRFFQVDGGTNRFITVGSTDDVNIAAELEQACTHKNIILYLPPTTDGNDMETALELTNVALDKKLSLYVGLTVEKHSAGKRIETFMLTGAATLKQRPFIVGTQMLKVELRLPSAHWFHGKVDKNNKLHLNQM